MFLEQVVEGFAKEALHGSAALDGEFAQLPRHFGREMSGDLLDACRPGLGARSRRAALLRLGQPQPDWAVASSWVMSPCVDVSRIRQIDL